ncbi:MAG: cysteine--tRNA ligase [Deltaproteobacteria bacterium]|nr:MAG: cysteine--tRNA ligase [Deltaproteobacteria bacterium]
MTALRLYNTRTRRKEVFEPLEPGQARVYTCGPTVYAPQHIGNLVAYLFADQLKRALLAEGLRVTHVINITDVGHLTSDADTGEDKLEKQAAATGRSAAEIAAQYTAQWKRDCERVGCLEADVYCKATEHIAEQIELVRTLEAKGYTYRIDDGIYFDTSRFPHYAEFARLKLDEQKAGARIGDVPGKRAPADFGLWKFASPGVKRQQEWDSPWGRGFPGWHVECSAMSVKYLGANFDIHTGGVDHIPVHHTNEIAQSECALGIHPWVRYWMHTEFMELRGEKISKSKGHTLVLDDLAARGFEPLAFRYFVLQAHYRQQQTFSFEALEAAATGYGRLLLQAMEVRDAPGEADPERIAPLRERFRDAVRDDLNAPQALALAHEVARDSALPAPERRALLLEFDAFLGLDLARAVPRQAESESDPAIDARVAEREAARTARDFARADRIRDELAAEGIAIEDTPSGPRWRRSR